MTDNIKYINKNELNYWSQLNYLIILLMKIIQF